MQRRAGAGGLRLGAAGPAGAHPAPSPLLSPNYISAEGAARLRAEFAHLFEVERPRVVNNVAAAAAEGDRSENAEYIYGKKRLREIDKRLRFLTGRLDQLEVVAPPTSAARIRFLSWVVLEDEAGEARVVRLVGADETDARGGLISWQSPVGRGLLGRAEDDEVVVQTPGGRKRYTILEVALERPAP